MDVFRDLRSIPKIDTTVSLTIGMFDGIHLGHQAVLNRLIDTCKTDGTQSVAISFENHPSEIITPASPVKLICTLPHKIFLLEQQQLDQLLLIPFTKEVASHSAEEFLRKVLAHYNVSHLVLGHDASFGKDREGNFAHITKMSKRLNFTVEYLPQTICKSAPVSSTLIRSLLEKGDLAAVSQLLGRKYSIYSQVIPGTQQGRAIGFPTMNIDLQGLCLPPLGVYAVSVTFDGNKYSGVANLGFAPTLKKIATPLLEVHIFGHCPPLFDGNADVEFVKFLRKEIKFADATELQHQIQQDILEAKSLLQQSWRGDLE